MAQRFPFNLFGGGGRRISLFPFGGAPVVPVVPVRVTADNTTTTINNTTTTIDSWMTGGAPTTPPAPTIPANALLDSTGKPILTSDGQYILT